MFESARMVQRSYDELAGTRRHRHRYGQKKAGSAMIDRIDHIVMNCRDVETTASWYERALGFRREAYTSPAEPGERIALKFGRHKFNLRQTGSLGWVTCKVDAPGSLDLCFITDGSLKPVIERLNSLGIPITVGLPRELVLLGA
jgi:catechol 2,3-dioxygenase-like lactoylglutathione lyase family enzyme